MVILVAYLAKWFSSLLHQLAGEGPTAASPGAGSCCRSLFQSSARIMEAVTFSPLKPITQVLHRAGATPECGWGSFTLPPIICHLFCAMLNKIPSK